MNKSLLAAPLVLLQLVLLASASPIRYDQRQDGDSNVDARLSNFFVVLAPSNTAQLSNTGVSLLDLASKAVPLRLRPQASADGLKQREEADQDQPEQEVKEVKTGRSVQAAPLAAMAIPAAILQSPLAKLHPEVQALAVEEVLIARSPVVALKTPPTPIGAPAAAVPMLVAIPVPEVAPERPAAPPAGLLPMHPLKQAPAAPAAAEATAIIAEAVAAPETIAAPIAAPEVAAAVLPEVNAVPEAATLSEAIAAAEAVAPVENAPPAVETNQVEPEIVKKVELPKIHLIGTGIEECGPERIRNQEGVCVDEPKQD